MLALGFWTQKPSAVIEVAELMQMIGFFPLYGVTLTDDSESFLQGINWFNSKNNPISVLLDETDKAPSEFAENANIYSHIFEANFGLMMTVAFGLALLYFAGLMLEKQKGYKQVRDFTVKLLKIYVLAAELPILVSVLYQFKYYEDYGDGIEISGVILAGISCVIYKQILILAQLIFLLYMVNRIESPEADGNLDLVVLPDRQKYYAAFVLIKYLRKIAFGSILIFVEDVQYSIIINLILTGTVIYRQFIFLIVLIKPFSDGKTFINRLFCEGAFSLITLFLLLDEIAFDVDVLMLWLPLLIILIIMFGLTCMQFGSDIEKEEATKSEHDIKTPKIASNLDDSHSFDNTHTQQDLSRANQNGLAGPISVLNDKMSRFDTGPYHQPNKPDLNTQSTPVMQNTVRTQPNPQAHSKIDASLFELEPEIEGRGKNKIVNQFSDGFGPKGGVQKREIGSNLDYRNYATQRAGSNVPGRNLSQANPKQKGPTLVVNDRDRLVDYNVEEAPHLHFSKGESDNSYN